MLAEIIDRAAKLKAGRGAGGEARSAAPASSSRRARTEKVKSSAKVPAVRKKK